MHEREEQAYALVIHVVGNTKERRGIGQEIANAKKRLRQGSASFVERPHEKHRDGDRRDVRIHENCAQRGSHAFTIDIFAGRRAGRAESRPQSTHE